MEHNVVVVVVVSGRWLVALGLLILHVVWWDVICVVVFVEGMRSGKVLAAN